MEEKDKTPKKETEVIHNEDATSVSGPLDTTEISHRKVANKVMNTIIHECPDGISLEDLEEIFELIKNAVRNAKVRYECFEC